MDIISHEYSEEIFKRRLSHCTLFYRPSTHPLLVGVELSSGTQPVEEDPESAQFLVYLNDIYWVANTVLESNDELVDSIPYTEEDLYWVANTVLESNDGLVDSIPYTEEDPLTWTATGKSDWIFEPQFRKHSDAAGEFACKMTTQYPRQNRMIIEESDIVDLFKFILSYLPDIRSYGLFLRARHNDHILVGSQPLCETDRNTGFKPDIDMPNPFELVDGDGGDTLIYPTWVPKIKPVIQRSNMYDWFCDICYDLITDEITPTPSDNVSEQYRCIECNNELPSAYVTKQRYTHPNRCPVEGVRVNKAKQDFLQWRLTGTAENTPLQTSINTF